jgi:glycosyltransferase involved in cell wall biosynthesis
MTDPEISVVVPLYNEEENIIPLYEELGNVLKKLKKTHEIIFIDDGSTDGTYKILKKIHDGNKSVRAIRFRRNFGQTAALGAGFDTAQGDIVISMDGDLQNDPEDIPNLLEKLDEGYDVVAGWRHEREDPISKKIPSKIANWLRELLLKENIHDSGCTLRAYRKDALKNIKLYGEMHRYIPALLGLRGFKVAETKVKHRERIHGDTKYTSGRIIRGFLDLLYMKFWADYATRPLHMFGALGLLQYFLGIVILIEQIIKAIIIKGLWLGPLLILSVMLIITGTLFILFGFLFEVQIRTYFENSGESSYEVHEILK